MPGNPDRREHRITEESMSERKTDIQEKEWSDEIPDEEEERPEPYEETYKDESAKNECWPE